jgi:hypothetical protein
MDFNASAKHVSIVRVEIILVLKMEVSCFPAATGSELNTIQCKISQFPRQESSILMLSLVACFPAATAISVRLTDTWRVRHTARYWRLHEARAVRAGSELTVKWPLCYGSQRYITVFTWTRHRTFAISINSTNTRIQFQPPFQHIHCLCDEQIHTF